MLGISAEHLLIVFVILLIFGPRRLPELGSTLGRTVRKFKESFNGMPEPEFKRLKTKKEDKLT